jgi:hypothetical protein
LKKLTIKCRNEVGVGSFGQFKVTERIEGIELLRKHENLPEGI